MELNETNQIPRFGMVQTGGLREMDINTLTIALAAALALSEALSLIPALRANGIFQLIYNTLRTLTGKQ